MRVVTAVNAACIYLVQVALIYICGRKSTKCGGLRIMRSIKGITGMMACAAKVEVAGPVRTLHLRLMMVIQ